MTESGVPEPPADIEPDQTVDNRGRGCASGIVEVQRAIGGLSEGAILKVESTDKRAREEYPKLARQTAHELIGITETRGGWLRTEYHTYLRIQ